MKKLSKQEKLALACLPPQAKSLNPLQKQFVKLAMTPVPRRPALIVSAPTNSGKTGVAHMMCHRPLGRGDSIVYIGISKALVQEKHDEWTKPEHPWSCYNISMITGDHSFTAKRESELNKANVIIATPEALLSRMTKRSSKVNSFLKRVRVFVVDEAHLVGSSGRGDVMEIVIKLAGLHYQKAQLVLVSGTLKNVEDFQFWLENINEERPVKVVVSDYTAVPITQFFVPTFDDYDSKKQQIEHILTDYPQQTMVAVYNKSFGEELTNYLTKRKFDCEFYCADIPFSERQRLESMFRSKNLKYLVCTSGLLTGINMPTENIIVTAMKAGGKEMPAFEIMQAAGRAGRKGYCDEGRQFFLVPPGKEQHHVNRIRNGEPIQSQLVDVNRLALHILHAVYSGEVTHHNDFMGWYETTLAYVQDTVGDNEIKKLLTGIVQALEKRGLVAVDGQDIKVTQYGKIVAQLLLSPLHFADIVQNFSKMGKKSSYSTLDIAVAYGYAADNRADYISEDDLTFVSKEVKERVPENYCAAVQCIYNRVREQPAPWVFAGLSRQLITDSERIVTGLLRVVSETKKLQHYRPRELCEIFIRIRSGMSKDKAKHELADLSSKEISALLEHRIMGVSEIKKRRAEATAALGLQRAMELGVAGTMRTGGSYR